MDTSTLWEKILIPLIVGPIFIMIKVLYDRSSFKHQETIILSNKLKLEKVNNKLQNFYWPLYILLLKDFYLWSKIILKDSDIEVTGSDSESEVENDEMHQFQFCNYIKNDGEIFTKCNNPVAQNCIDKSGAYCIKHQYKKHHKILETWNIFCNNSNTVPNIKTDIIDYNKERGDILSNNSDIELDIMSGSRDINIENELSDIILDVDNNINKFKEGVVNGNSIINDGSSNSSESMRSIINNINNTEYGELPGNITGNRIGVVSGINNSSINNTLELRSEMIKQITKDVISNHDKISDIILNNIALAEPGSFIGKQLMKYIKFINIFKSEVNGGGDLIDPSEYGAPYPKKLLPIVEIELFKLQKEYNKLVEEYYNQR